MFITLTEKQVVLLGWDDNSQQNPRPIKCSKKGWEFDLDDDYAHEMRDVAATFAFGGQCDPSAISSGKALLRKLTKLGF